MTKPFKPKRPHRPMRPNPPDPAVDRAGERLQKLLARAGVASRRMIDQWVREGRVTVNGRTAEPGLRCRPTDRITVNGRPIDLRGRTTLPTRVLLYHKPLGEVVTRHDPEGRPVIFTRLPRPERGRWIAVGRLDINTQGLLLVTNNGELANRLMHPSRRVEREYAVRVLGRVDSALLERLLRGVTLEDGLARFTEIRDAGGEGANHWFHVTTQEGRHRIVRRLWESQGVMVSRLLRVRFGNIALPAWLRAGACVELEAAPLRELMNSVGLEYDGDHTGQGQRPAGAPGRRRVDAPHRDQGGARKRGAPGSASRS